MSIQRVLIVPSEFVTTYSKRRLWKFKRVCKALRYRRFQTAFEVMNAHMLVAEVLHYADIPKILGVENTYMVGRYYRDYTRKSIPRHTRYPSLHKTPKGTYIDESELAEVIKKVEAVIICKRAGSLGDRARSLARKHDVFMAVVDHFDDLELYKNPDTKPLTDGLRYGQDYHLYFKHDIPLGRASDTLLPIAPMPVRVESYPVAAWNGYQRDISVFYRGQQRLGVLRGDRHQLAELIRSHIPSAVIDNQPKRKTFSVKEYWEKLARSLIAYTPSGKVWDSTRHCETALFGCVPLIPQPDCETVNSAVRNGENAIAYETQRTRNGEYVVVNVKKTLDRVKEVLSDGIELPRIAESWRQEVFVNHTTEARARYLVDAINQKI